MALRIGTNVHALTTLRKLTATDRNVRRAMEHIATGERITKASDDPSGLVISEQLRGQIEALHQAVDNSENALHVLSTVEAALQEISNLLIEIKDSVVFALNRGATTPDQIAAEQKAIDSAIYAIERIAATKRFADVPLLNGCSAYKVSAQSASIVDLRLRQVDFLLLEERSFNFELRQVARQAMIDFGGASVSAVENTTIRIGGMLGTRDVHIHAGASNVAIAKAINDVAGFTGMWASGTGDTLTLYSVEFGSNEVISFSVVSGQLQVGNTILTPPNPIIERGQDAILRLNGQEFRGRGFRFDITTPFLTAQFTLGIETRDHPIGTIYPISVLRSGLQFQLGEKPDPTDILSVGIENLGTGLLGFKPIPDIASNVAGTSGGNAFSMNNVVGGYLNSLLSGQPNDLSTARSTTNALKIIDAVIAQISTLRAFLGGVVSNTIEPNMSSLEVTLENLAASHSTIRDLDYAMGMSEFVKQQILLQAGISVLAQANVIPQNVLALIQR